MDIHTHGRTAPDHDAGGRRAFIRFGLWVRLALIGVLVAAGGVASLVEGVQDSVAALAASLGGGALAAFAWRRVAAGLARGDAPNANGAAIATDHVDARHVRKGRSADALRSRGALAARQA